MFDPDAGDSHTFQTSDARFEVDGAGNLKLVAGASLDFESEPSVSVNVTATDGGGLDVAESFTIAVNDVNDVPVDISLSNASVDENEAGASIGTISVVDPDAGDSHLLSVDDSRFEISGNELRLKAGVSLDFESEQTVTVIVTATDLGGLQRSESFVIAVQDISDVLSEDGDTLQGSSGDDTITGLGGDDSITGGAGDDEIDAGGGDDTIIWNSGDGNDVILGGTGFDEVVVTLDAGASGDVSVTSVDGRVVVTSTGSDIFTLDIDDVEDLTIIGGDSGLNIVFGDISDTDISQSTITIIGGNGDDLVDASVVDKNIVAEMNGVNDTVTTGSGDDIISGGAGNDYLDGGTGDNTLSGGAGDDTLTGGTQASGFDFNTADYRDATGAVSINLSASSSVTGDASVGTDTLLVIERVFGSAFDDVYVADGGFSGQYGSFNEFRGGAGDDLITGNGVTRVSYRDAGPGGATVDFDAGSATGDGVGTDTFTGGVNQVRGSDFDDQLLGSNGGGFESFRGQAGNDFIDGRGGDFDRADYANSEGTVIVNMSDVLQFGVAAGTAQDGFGSVDTLVNIENIRGS